MPYLVCYDISSTKKRSKIAKELVNSGFVRIQKSVFIGMISSTGVSLLAKRLQALMGHKTAGHDKIHFLKIHEQALLNMLMLGQEMDTRLLLGKDRYLIL
ncbi:CRISPR-associated endonuclease Cas2 [Haliscomenobacter hydrossis]|uniref:CRISPR-associated endoribonuclease Cas2 n=1 Tax=Haliscomenobacter hydrossis (strain ATCC 27775 / DSM 1100 / LMG 10767 / O) TaxID=760192 RepID=F4L828_HALH1|nr:CRISPR-associated endonuclease Cas2 [Haliscomenobacter hydrossis]AEE54536.1 CRISPR-associated protein Cas2 [Haliscomenobacter hydrossis DSM 1100]